MNHIRGVCGMIRGIQGVIGVSGGGLHCGIPGIIRIVVNAARNLRSILSRHESLIGFCLIKIVWIQYNAHLTSTFKL